MEAKLLSDRVRANPETGALTQRDLPQSEATRRLEADFADHKVVRSPRGGVASFQVVVISDGPTDGADTTVKAGPFKAGGESLEQVSLFYEWPCQAPAGEWTFEALIPVDAYRAAGEDARKGPLGLRRCHAFWVDVPVPREARPGTYRGHVSVDGTEVAEVAIDVLPLTLPLVPRVTISLNSYSTALHTQHHPGLSPEEQVACERSYYREAHDNRTVLHYLPYDHAGNVAEGYAPPLAGRGRNLRVADWAAYDRRFGPLFDGSAMAGSPGGERPIPHWCLPFNYDWPADFAYFGTRGYETEFAQVMAEFRRHFQERGWTGTTFEVYFNQKKRYRYFPWDGDERKQTADRPHFLYFRQLLDRSAQIAGQAGAAARIANRTDISWSYAQDVIDDQMGPLFDLWVANQGNFAWTRYGVAAIHDRSQLAWWYGGCRGPVEPIMDADRQAILCWRRGGDGFLPNWLCMAFDGMLDQGDELSMLYPGRRFGWDRALGSICLRRARCATETTDLLEMLGGRGRELVDAVAEATEEDWFTPTPDWVHWPTELMTNEMYGWQKTANPFADRDPQLPALIRARAIDLLLT